MSVDWPIKKLSEVADFLNHKRVPLKSLDRDKRQGEYPYYGASGVVDHIDDYIFNGTYLLISEDGENLKTRNTPIAFKASGKFWVNNHAHILDEKEEGVLDYLEYYFSKLNIGPYLTGAVQPKLNKANLDSIEIPTPPKKERLFLNRVLNSFTNKIELNRQTNQTLEQIAQALFKSWFVDFEPTRAKIAAKQNGQDPERAAMAAISGKTLAELDDLSAAQQTQLNTTAALFPDTLIDSELGEIPEGWEVITIKELATKISKGTTPSKGDITKAADIEAIPFLKVRDISNDGEITRTGLDKIPESIHNGALKRSVLETNDLLFSIAGTIGRVAIVEEDLSNSNCNQAVAFIRLKDSRKHLDLCRLNLVDSRVQDEVVSKVVQGVQANFSLTGLGEIKIIIPSDEVLACLNKTIGDTATKQRLLLRENRSLAELRDSLLPKLLSGELSIEPIKEAAYV